MGKWSRSEIEEAFATFQSEAAKAGATGVWDGWANLFTEDAEYVEHLYGKFHGRAEILAWIQKAMKTPPADEMNAFPIEWYIIDEERGWLVCQVWNRMVDPGDGSVHQAHNFTLLKYAGDGQWSYEEDIYNPAAFGKMISDWQKVRNAHQSQSG